LKEISGGERLVEGNDIVYTKFRYRDVGFPPIAALIVPVLRDADLQSFAEIEKSIGNSGAARAGTITMEGTHGRYFHDHQWRSVRIAASTPSSILRRVRFSHAQDSGTDVVIDASRGTPMMYIALTYDHRIIDGREAVQFLVTVKHARDPARMVLGV